MATTESICEMIMRLPQAQADLTCAVQQLFNCLTQFNSHAQGGLLRLDGHLILELNTVYHELRRIAKSMTVFDSAGEISGEHDEETESPISLSIARAPRLDISQNRPPTSASAKDLLSFSRVIDGESADHDTCPRKKIRRRGRASTMSASNVPSIRMRLDSASMSGFMSRSMFLNASLLTSGPTSPSGLKTPMEIGEVKDWLSQSFTNAAGRQSVDRGFNTLLTSSPKEATLSETSIVSSKHRDPLSMDDSHQTEESRLLEMSRKQESGSSLPPPVTTAGTTGEEAAPLNRTPRNAEYGRSECRKYPSTCSRCETEMKLKSCGLESIQEINEPDFDIFPYHEQHGANVFTTVVANVLFQYNFIASLQLDVDKLVSFLRDIQRHYRDDNPYHNACHAADVVQTMNVYLSMDEVRENFSDLELLAGLFSALIHDVGHLGISNAFLVKAKHPLARLYNDKSPLENMHVALAFLLLEKEENNFFADSVAWTRAYADDFRSLVVEIVSGTDMKMHAEHVTTAKTILSDGLIEDNEVGRLFCCIVHAADLSNPLKPKKIYHNWAERVMAEFWQQGDEEVRRGMSISMMCDRRQRSLAKSQVGFIEFVVRPFMTELVSVLPPIWMERLDSNAKAMKEMTEEEQQTSLSRIDQWSSVRWKDLCVADSFFAELAKFIEEK